MPPDQRSTFDRLIGGPRRADREAAECSRPDQRCARRQEFPTLHGMLLPSGIVLTSEFDFALNTGTHSRGKFGADGSDAELLLQRHAEIEDRALFEQPSPQRDALGNFEG